MSRDDHETPLLHQAAARCLVYPEESLYRDLPLLDAALAPLRLPAAALLRSFVADASATEPQQLAAHYVNVFDFKNRRCLYLSWWADGDTRRRGMSLVRFKQVYREHGLEFTDEELPDYLPAVLEFAAATGHLDLLHEHRPGLELLRLALTDADTPYVKLLEAVCATLPGTSPKDRAAAMAMIRRGPPREDVGLEPYGQFDLLPVLTGEPS